MIMIEHQKVFKNKLKKIILLDRDGVINLNKKNYIKKFSDIKIFDEAIRALEILYDNNIGVIIITNQQVIGKKILSYGEAIDIHLNIVNSNLIKKNPIIASFICPHLKSENCSCRKPGIRMIESAIKLYKIDRESTFFIGDSLTDIEAALSANVKPILLSKSYFENNILVFKDLFEASKYICK